VKRLLVLLLAGSLGLSLPAHGATRDRWDTRVLARVESPGFPAHVYVHPGNGRVYAGTFSNPNGDSVPSVVREWTRGGTLLRSWTVPGQDLAKSHGVQVATSDAAGRLIILDKTSGRVLRLNVRSGRFTTYGLIPGVGSERPIPNYAAWGPGGALFVTDYAQPVIWKVPRGGGRAQAWFTSRKLDGLEFGTAGLVLAPDHRSLLVMQQTSLGLGEVMLPTGKLYRLSFSDKRLTKLWESMPMDLPDGFSFAASGRVYIANAGSNQLVVLSPQFKEIERTPGLPLVGDNGSEIAFDTPSNMTFAGRSVLIANQAFLGNTDNHAILDVYVGEPGLPVFIPRSAG
jgi:sugar lactone lactonase YvrE